MLSIVQHRVEPLRPALGRYAPGLLLCTGVALAAVLLQRVEAILLGRAWLEALVLAILLGAAIRMAWTPSARWHCGIDLSARLLLEIAVMLLGASLDTGAILAAGAGLPLGIAGVVVLAIGASYGIGRLLGLPRRMATLIACGNSICGNSAIAAVAPVIGAEGGDVAASIGFTAVLGVVVVLVLPLAVPLLHLSATQYGTLAGLTVYAVPQVFAASAPMGAAAVQIGTLVKLMRVLMLGPVVLVLAAVAGGGGGRVRLHRLVPWFIAGFVALATLRAAGGVPHAALPPLAGIASVLTVVSMAALGLSTDLRAVAGAGGRIAAVVIASLLVLAGLSIGLLRLLAVA
ncbi:YeiH family protein [Lichenicoccus roseus]|uniref:Putative sulfate exporter family transporter n=1 Tax=Lichenicoccus roseus TaxID=2683649 RepID=A0A5R9JCG2_9PROT|nr:putative sulfate exporter family transporter [Lichenicoccus roseus]TLU74453.1 putative sulfate exporter family transporter [Lichenicoccus roseus]